MSFPTKYFLAGLCAAVLCTTVSTQASDRETLDRKVQPVIGEVDKFCREQGQG